MTEKDVQEAAVHEEALQAEAAQEEAMRRIMQKGPAGRGAAHEDGVQDGPHQINQTHTLEC